MLREHLLNHHFKILLLGGFLVFYQKIENNHGWQMKSLSKFVKISLIWSFIVK